MAHPVTALTPANVAKVVELVASGHTHAQVASALGCSVSTIKRALAAKDAKERVAELRAVIRREALEGCQAIVPAAQAWLAQVVKDKKDPRAADALSRDTRSLLNLEKVSSSASGENREPKPAKAAEPINIVFAPGWGPGPNQPQTITIPATPAPPLALSVGQGEVEPPIPSAPVTADHVTPVATP